MIAELHLSVSDIQPFVRHVQLLHIHPCEYPVFTKSYDCRLFYVYRGTGTVYIEDRVYTVEHDNMVLWQPGFDYRMDVGEGGMQFLCINFDYTANYRDKDYPIPPDRSDLYDMAQATKRILFTDMEALNQPVFLRGMQVIEDELLEMKREYQSRKIFWRERLGGLMTSVIGNVARKLTLSVSDGAEGETYVDQLIAYIQAHSDESLTNTELGRLFSYHPNYLNRLMLLHTGKTIRQYVIACRIAKAIELLESTDMPIAEIAEKTGAGSISHFSKLFTSKTGKNPSFYRRPR